MYYLILFLLVGLSFSPLFLRSLDVWHAQGFFAQAMILAMFCLSLFEKPKNRISKNLPLSLLTFWMGVHVLFFVFMAATIRKYDTAHFFPFFNWICLILFYKYVTEYLGQREILKILNVLRFVLIITLITCVLQYFKLSQFFKLITPENFYGSSVVGFIGNGTHLSGFIATWLPLFFLEKKSSNVLWVALLLLVLCFTGTRLNDPSVSGFFIATLMFLFYAWRKSVGLLFIVVGCLGLVGFLVFWQRPEVVKMLFHWSGRLLPWQYYWELFHQLPVTGAGLGAINLIAPKTPFPEMRHLHLAYFHAAFEIGIVGLALIIYLIKEFFRSMSGTEIQVILKLIVFGFCINGLFNYPERLWLPATWAMFAYASFYAIKNEGVENGNL